MRLSQERSLRKLRNPAVAKFSECIASWRFGLLKSRLALLGFVAIGSAFIPPSGDASSLTLRAGSEEAVRTAQAGDLVFRLGKSVWSPYFGGLNSFSGFSHVGVLIEVSPDLLAVVHAEADDDGQNGAVKLTSLNQFIHDSLTFEIKKNLMPSEQKQAFLLATRRHWLADTPFDAHFTLRDDAKSVYCTELVWHASQATAGYTMGDVETIAGRDIISVDSIYRSTFLK